MQSRFEKKLHSWKKIFNLLLTFFPLAELIAVSNPGESRGNTIETILGNPFWASFDTYNKLAKLIEDVIISKLAFLINWFCRCYEKCL